jgi:hypothetical protein
MQSLWNDEEAGVWTDDVLSVAGPAFSKTTGARVPIDGGNERVI